MAERFHERLEQACVRQEAQAECEEMLAANVGLENMVRANGRTPLCTVCAMPRERSQNKHATLTMLLHRGADANGRDAGDCSALHYAASDNDTVSCRLLLAAGADRDARSATGATPAYAASAHGCIHALHLLLANGADVNAQQGDGSSPIFISAQSNSVSIMRTLLAHGADPSTPLRDGRTPLAIACRIGNLAAVRLLLRSLRRRSRGLHPLPASVVRNICRRTASFASPASQDEARLPRHPDRQRLADEGYIFPEDEILPQHDYSYIRTLREQRAHARLLRFRSPSANEQPGGQEEDEEDTAWVLEEDDDGETRATDGERPVQGGWGEERKNEALDALVRESREEETTAERLLHVAVEDAAGAAMAWRAFGEPEREEGEEEAAERALRAVHSVEGESDLNAADAMGTTPLQVACAYGHTRIVLCLLRHGADMMVLDKSMRNVLWASTVRKHSSTALAVLDHAGSSGMGLLRQADGRGVSPLFLSCEHSLEAVVSAMLCRPIVDLQSLLRATTFSGHSPLFAACYAGSALAVRVLTMCGADTKQEGPGGRLCLNVACERGHLDVVAALMKKPHTVSAVVRGIDVARQHGHHAIVNLLSPLVPPTLLKMQ